MSKFNPGTIYGMNGKVTYKTRRLQRRQPAQAHNSTLNSRLQSFI
jgi:hypothetical protein